MREHFVYTLLDSAGGILYVGCSCEPHKRIRGHKNKDWFCNVKGQKIYSFSDKRSALMHEAKLIRELSPKYNKAAPSPEKMRDPPMAAKQLIEWIDAEGKFSGWLAKTIPAHPSTVSQWLAGAKTPQPIYRHRLAQITGLDIAAKEAWE